MIEIFLAGRTLAPATQHALAHNFHHVVTRASAAVEPVEAVEDEVERERELGAVIAWSEGASVGDREGHLHGIRMGGTELAFELGGRTRIEVPGIVEERL